MRVSTSAGSFWLTLPPSASGVMDYDLMCVCLSVCAWRENASLPNWSPLSNRKGQRGRRRADANSPNNEQGGYNAKSIASQSRPLIKWASSMFDSPPGPVLSEAVSVVIHSTNLHVALLAHLSVLQSLSRRSWWWCSLCGDEGSARTLPSETVSTWIVKDEISHLGTSSL